MESSPYCPGSAMVVLSNLCRTAVGWVIWRIKTCTLYNL